MTYRVSWSAEAERSLATLWVDSDDRAGLTKIIDDLDAALGLNPLSVGESREGSTRIAIEGRLAALFRVDADRRTVTVLALWRAPGPGT